MKENFEFEAAASHVSIRVVVKGIQITLYEARSRLCTGIWDSGQYVRYAYSPIGSTSTPPSSISSTLASGSA